MYTTDWAELYESVGRTSTWPQGEKRTDDGTTCASTRQRDTLVENLPRWPGISLTYRSTTFVFWEDCVIAY